MSVRDGLLALLDHGPRYGYQLKTEFETATGGVWSLNIGQVYTTLERLKRDGLVEVDAAPEDDQKRYSLTTQGRELLGEWWLTVPAEDPPPRDELQLKVLLAIEAGREHALEVITRQRTALTRLLQERRRSGPGRGRPRSRAGRPAKAAPSSSGELAAKLVADALVVRAEADLRWLDLCEGRLLRSDSFSDAT